MKFKQIGSVLLLLCGVTLFIWACNSGSGDSGAQSLVIQTTAKAPECTLGQSCSGKTDGVCVQDSTTGAKCVSREAHNIGCYPHYDTSTQKYIKNGQGGCKFGLLCNGTLIVEDTECRGCKCAKAPACPKNQLGKDCNVVEGVPGVCSRISSIKDRKIEDRCIPRAEPGYGCVPTYSDRKYVANEQGNCTAVAKCKGGTLTTNGSYENFTCLVTCSVKNQGLPCLNDGVIGVCAMNSATAAGCVAEAELGDSCIPSYSNGKYSADSQGSCNFLYNCAGGTLVDKDSGYKNFKCCIACNNNDWWCQLAKVIYCK
ncbi:hypothetical protein JYT19_01080 [Sulfobacillus acidophilus]|uniref:Uncharacterized protein n=1 Tax=Sulfobacillus acidophilus TaxID=53633 RepID=A0ABS3AW92_9FIRM|nr:hypothetical protein [Sulfobacillus acidophilus]